MTPPLDEPTLGEVHRTMTAGFTSLTDQLRELRVELHQDYVPRTELDVRFKEVDTRIAAVAADLAQQNANRQWTIGQWVVAIGILVTLLLGGASLVVSAM